MQSVEPGSGISSTLSPASAYQPILVAIANGAAADVTPRAHQPTFTEVSAACAASVPAKPADNEIAKPPIAKPMVAPIAFMLPPDSVCAYPGGRMPARQA